MYCKAVYELVHTCVHISRCVQVEREMGIGGGGVDRRAFLI